MISSGFSPRKHQCEACILPDIFQECSCFTVKLVYSYMIDIRQWIIQNSNGSITCTTCEGDCRRLVHVDVNGYELFKFDPTEPLLMDVISRYNRRISRCGQKWLAYGYLRDVWYKKQRVIEEARGMIATFTISPNLSNRLSILRKQCKEIIANDFASESFAVIRKWEESMEGHIFTSLPTFPLDLIHIVMEYRRQDVFDVLNVYPTPSQDPFEQLDLLLEEYKM